VVSVFDVSQTSGKELPDITVDELSGNVENYKAFFSALESISPVPIAFEDIPGGAKGYYHLEDRRIAIQEGMSEIQPVKPAIHEIAHAKLHAIDPTRRQAPKNARTVGRERLKPRVSLIPFASVTALETSDYSFGMLPMEQRQGDKGTERLTRNDPVYCGRHD
jgi:hypothetical protein